MRFVLERVSDPEIEPVTLAEAIRQVREFNSIPQGAQDDLTALIVAGREWAEDYTGRALIDQMWRLTIGNRLATYSGDTVGGFRSPGLVNPGLYYGLFMVERAGEIRLRKSPVLAITKFATVDVAGVESEVDSSTYALRESDSKWPRIVGLNGATWWPQFGNVLRIEFRAGFADRTGSPQQDASAIPERFKQAIRLWVEAMYDRDPAMMDKLFDAAKAIIKPERVEVGFA